MRGWRAAAVVVLGLLAACTQNSSLEGREPTDRPTDSSESSSQPVPTPVQSGAVALEVTDVLTDLDTVWAMAFGPDGSLHFTERGGRLSRLPPGGGTDDLEIVEIDGVREQGEAGLMGLAIDDQGRRFVMYTAVDENRIVRLDDNGDQTVLVDGIRAGNVHDGGRLAFGPDAMLYASTGDAGESSSVRREGSRNGKILRIDPDSGDFDVFTTGHRNPQGLCFTTDGALLSTEHGPDRGDEVNLLEEGKDYGWPDTTGTGIVNYTPTVAPAGCSYYEADLIPQWKESLLFVTLKDASLRRIVLSDDRKSEVSQERLYQGEFGRLRDVVVGPDGAVYLATSNHDGRGDPASSDDRILRIAPLPTQSHIGPPDL